MELKVNDRTTYPEYYSYLIIKLKDSKLNPPYLITQFLPYNNQEIFYAGTYNDYIYYYNPENVDKWTYCDSLRIMRKFLKEKRTIEEMNEILFGH